MIGKILLAYDGSDSATRAMDVAAELSSKLRADLYIVHVLMHGRPAREFKRLAEVENLVTQSEKPQPPHVAVASGRSYDLLGHSTPDGHSASVISAMGDRLVSYAKDRSKKSGAIVVQTLVRAGDDADKILEAADDLDVDMIVVGSRGLGRVRGAILGSVSQKLLHHANQTVVTVK